MNHPPYHLRPNKAVDRFLLLETLRYLGVKDYTYYGLGGPFLEDCRLLKEYFPSVKIVSIEENEETYKRQIFHKFDSEIILKKGDIKTFLRDFDGKGREIFWLDYVDTTLARFDEFKNLLSKAMNGTIVKITIRADEKANPYSKKRANSVKKEEIEKFKNILEDNFKGIFPSNIKDEDFRKYRFPTVVQKMIQICAQQAMPASSGSVFQILNSAYYSDGTVMLSVTGIACEIVKANSIKTLFKDWKFANLSWKSPQSINLPVLTIKERLKLERLLPKNINAGKILVDRLGYLIVEDANENENMMQQYADFYPYYPYFSKVKL